MPKPRKQMDAKEKEQFGATKKFVRYKEGAMLYSVGLHTFQNLAKDANATIRYGRVVLVDTEKIDAYIEAIGSMEE